MKVLLLSSHTPSYFWFRVDMMKDMLLAGWEVVAAGQMPEAEWAGKFKEIGVRYTQINVARNGLNPLGDIATLKEIRRLLTEERPDKIFAFQAKTIVYGAMAARQMGITEFYPMVGGLGSIFRGHGLKNKVLRAIMLRLYKQAFTKSRKVFFQNNDDKKVMVDAGLLPESQIVMIHGSGVNLHNFAVVDIPQSPAFLYIGRLIKDKGVCEYLESCRKIKQILGDKVRCMLVGPFDSNPSALKPQELQPLIDSGVIEYFGEQSDVRPFIAQASIYVLPSYHEGTPKTVLENMAMGRPIITTDVPGCRETVVNGSNGYLVEAKNVDALVDKMQYLAQHPDLVLKMGRKSREMAESTFDVKSVNRTILSTMGMI
ncbi:MAG: glycosyltransferase family 4 protein [Bacteroidaceae bacterium]|nr:glycosyltransferase family 4 protein [Bacteroidaceae bacterium]